MREEMGKIPIIGEKEKSLCIKIEPTYGIDSPFYIFKEIKDSRSSLRIFDGGKIASRFIEEEDNFRFKVSETLPVYFDVIFGGIGFETQCLNDLAIDHHPSFHHHLLGLSPRGDSGFG
jgi:hypothetical protein